jgi:RNA polymerase sigma-70 factor, ECF subfamily
MIEQRWRGHRGGAIGAGTDDQRTFRLVPQGMTETRKSKASHQGTSRSAPSDGVLLKRFQNRDFDAATQLYVRYAQRIRNLAQSQCSAALSRQIEPDDIVQSVFGSFFRRAAQGEYQVPDGSELWRLLLSIALNKIRAKGIYHSAHKRDVRRTKQMAAVEKWIEPARQGDDAVPYAFLKMVIHEAMDDLSSAEKTMIAMRIDGYEVAEIAEKTKTSKRSVERSLQEFRSRLALILADSN